MSIPPNKLRARMADTTRLKREIDGQDRAHIILDGAPDVEDTVDPVTGRPLSMASIRARRDSVKQSLLHGMSAQQDTLAALRALRAKSLPLIQKAQSNQDED